MVSLLILLLGIFTAGLVIGVFLMTLLRFKQINAVTNIRRETGGIPLLLGADAATSSNQP